MNPLKKIDIRGFLRSLGLDACGTIHDIIIRYTLSSFQGFLLKFKDSTPWLRLLKDILSTKRFLLIILDSARYDLFKLTYPRYLKGILRKAVVPPPHTYGWLPQAFSISEFDHVKIFYASLSIVTHDIRIKDLVPRGRNLEVHIVRPSKLKSIGTVLPFEVNRVIYRKGLCGRDIVWYVQPHFPWVCDRDLSLKLMREVLIHDYMPPDVVRRKLKALGIDRKRVVKAYVCNLLIALRGVKELLDIVKRFGIRYDRIVVTSDHGEMLGEYGLYLHQEYDLPQLTTVPWLEVLL